MADQPKKPHTAYGVWREPGRGPEILELGPMFINEDGSGGFGH